MKYYLTFVKHISDGTEARECLSMEEGLITLKSTMYTKCGSAMADPNCDYCFGVIHNPLGQNMVQPVSFQRPVEVEEEPEA